MNQSISTMNTASLLVVRVLRFHTKTGARTPARVGRLPTRFRRSREATQWLERYRQFWEAQFQRLDALLLDLQTGAARTSKSAVNPGRRKRMSRNRR